MMKKLMGLAVLGAVAALATGCSGTQVRDGFVVPMYGAVYSDMRTPAMVQPKIAKDYVVVKRGVTAEATMISYFAFISSGDASYAKLKSAALAQASGADDLIDIEVDSIQKNVIGINEITIKLTGTAIKYKN